MIFLLLLFVSSLLLALLSSGTRLYVRWRWWRGAQYKLVAEGKFSLKDLEEGRAAVVGICMVVGWPSWFVAVSTGLTLLLWAAAS